MKGQRFFAVACASAMLLVSASAFAQLSDDERKCSDAFNKAVRNVGNQEQKANRKCIKDNLSGDASSCVNAISAKAADKELKIEGLFLTGEKCDPNASFGVNNGGGGDDAGKAAEEGTDDILRALWGDPVDGIVTGDKCADAVAKRTGKIYDTVLKAFRKCAKDAAAIGTIGVLEACVGTAVNDAKVATFQGKLDGDVVNKCNASAPIVDGTEDGDCNGSLTQPQLSACAGNVAQCNACLTLNETTGGNADCDTLDDGSANGSCGGAAAHKCTFDGATDNSSLQICFLGVCPAPINVSGAIDITCDPALQDGNGKRPCQSDLQVFNPFVLSGVGTICIDPAGPCPDGEIDCDGGNALGLDMIADHEIGSCTGNADCDGQCATYCAGLPSHAVYNGACENFCQSGTRTDLACICDVATGATCSGGVAGVNDCPGGSCEGKDNELDASCHCTCLDAGDGAASPAGGAQIRVGIAIRVEADPVCDNVQVLVRLPPQCAPFTTDSAIVTQLDANEDGSGTQGPWTESGVAGNCANFDGSSTVDFEFASGLAFMDSTIGDLQSRLNVDCN